MLPAEIFLLFLSGISCVSATAVRRVIVADLPTITTGPDPRRVRELLRRDDSTRTYATVTQDPSFVGWYIGQSTQAKYCADGQTWTSSGNFAKCCSTGTQCAQTVACSANSYMVDDSGSLALCPTGYECASVTVYSEYPAQNPVYNLLCVNNQWSAFTMYRDIASTHTSSTGSVTTTTTTSTATGPPTNTGSPSSSKAWIAGAVAGPVVGLALLFGIGFYLWRRRKNAGHAAPGNSNFVMHENQTDYKPYGPGTPYAPNTPAPAYYDAQHHEGGNNWRQSATPMPPSEADSRPVEVHPVELPATAHSVI